MSDGSVARRWHLEHLDDFTTPGPALETLLEASLYLMDSSLGELGLEPRLRPLFLKPVNGYEFPKPRKFRNLDRPRPLGVDPIAWILENVE